MEKTNSESYKVGQQLLSLGKVGCLLVSGGQGTRLGLLGPKGCCPITAVRGKTLFQYFEDRLNAACQQAGQNLKMAIMTSFENNDEVIKCFEGSDRVQFFMQGQLPFKSETGETLPFFGPDGNGSSIKAFFKSPLGLEWENAGIEYVTFISIDNPLADPFDAHLIGAHALSDADATLKCILRNDPNEKLGIVVNDKGRIKVVEYSEVSRQVQESIVEYPIGNISLFCFSFSFLKRVSQEDLPLHKAFKKINNESDRFAWKFERFIFDVLEYSEKTEILVCPREECFAPIKDCKTLEAAKKSLSAFDQRVLERITGKKAPGCLEIDPQFYYPTPALLKKWEGRCPPDSSYVEA